MSEAWALLAGLAPLCQAIAAAADTEAVLQALVAGLATHLAIRHSLVLLLDERGRRLFTVASLGFERSGVGSEVAIAEGPIGIAADRRIPVRLASIDAALRYARTARQQALQAGQGEGIAHEIPMPGLRDVRSILAVPLLAGDALVGVLAVESAEAGAFSADHEHALTCVAALSAIRLLALREAALEEEPVSAAPPGAPSPSPDAQPLVVRYYTADDSVFLDREYLIKGIAGRILWKLVRENRASGRTEFSNRELRLDASLALPEIKDNLESRLILLTRRLEERRAGLCIVKAGRGRFRLEILRPLVVET